MKILAIDPATACGWAISNEIYGLWNLKTKKDESTGMKWIRLKSKLKELYEVEKFDIIVYERPAGRHTASVISTSKLCGVIEMFALENGIQYAGFSATEIKKFATGKGNSGKPQMIQAAKDKYGYEGEDDNEADALHLLNLAKENLT